MILDVQAFLTDKKIWQGQIIFDHKWFVLLLIFLKI